jgi:SAM-dependent methyltransferase
MARSSGLPEESLPSHARLNRSAWNRDSDGYQTRNAPFLDIHGGLAWGVWQIPEAELRVLGDVRGKDILELGCGAAQWSIGLARLGARPVGLDLSERQLEHARRAMKAAGLSFPLVHGSAEEVPLADATCDIVFCDWGGMSFADPQRTVPEAARLLRPGGLLAFNGDTPISWLCTADDEERPGTALVRDYFGMHALSDGEYVNFMLPYGEWIRLFRRHGFEVEDLVEIRPPEGAESTYIDPEDREWFRRWPGEQIWKVRKTR